MTGERSSSEVLEGPDGQQSGDPAKLARALITIASQEPPPRRFIAGADAIATAEQKVADLKAQIDSNEDLSTSLISTDYPLHEFEANQPKEKAARRLDGRGQ